MLRSGIGRREAILADGTLAEDLATFFRGYPQSRPLFDAVREAIELLGSVEIKVGKSQVSFGRPRAFGWAWIPGRYLRGSHAPLVLSLALDRKSASSRWKSVIENRGGHFMHHMEISSADQLDGEVLGWLRRAYRLAV